MDMNSERRLAASRQAVWAALNDADVIKQCIPGCESLEKLSDTEMTAKVKLGIGPVHATFTGKVTLSDLDPPNGYRLPGRVRAVSRATPGAARPCISRTTAKAR